MDLQKKIGVIGAGAWGTALAMAFERAGFDVLMWAFEKNVVDDINKNHQNSAFLDGFALSPKIRATNSYADFKEFQALLMVCPTQHIRKMTSDLYQYISKETLLIVCSKGIEIDTGKLPIDMIREKNPTANLAVLSGPSFAKDVAMNLPTALSFAYPNQKEGLEICKQFASKTFRPYWSDDLIGTEIGGAIKNIIAIGCGIIAGKDWGDNAKAGLITRGLHEMALISKAMGGKSETLMGLSGLGDLTLTCNSLKSRNMSLGFALGQGQSLDLYLKDKKTICEGLKTAEAVPKLLELYDLELPTCQAIYDILIRKQPIDQVLDQLLSRPIKAEGVC